MLEYLFSLSDTRLFTLLICVFVLGSLIPLVIFKKSHLISMRYKDNEGIGNIGALVGIIYGVLVGITALYLINNIDHTADAVQREANGVANVYRDSQWLSDPQKTNIRQLVVNYLNEVIKTEWPEMEKGKSVSNEGNEIINNIASEVNTYRLTHPTDFLVPRDMYDDIKTLYNAREQRLHMSNSQLNSELWIVILIGTLLIIIVNFFLKISFQLHLITMGIISLMASSMIFLLITLDSPFQGDFVVEPDALQKVLNHIENNK